MLTLGEKIAALRAAGATEIVIAGDGTVTARFAAPAAEHPTWIPWPMPYPVYPEPPQQPWYPFIYTTTGKVVIGDVVDESASSGLRVTS